MNEEDEMRQEFVATTSRLVAERKCPWACAVVKVEGGYLCFESSAAAETWQAQK